MKIALRNLSNIFIKYKLLRFLILLVSIFGSIVSIYSVHTSLNLQSKAVNNSIGGDKEFSVVTPIESGKQISTFKVSGYVSLLKKNSFIRVILVDAQKKEYLVYETNPLIASSNSFPITDACEETCILGNITPIHYRIDGFGANFDISKITSSFITNKNSSGTIIQQSLTTKLQKDNIKIKAINDNMKSKSGKWVAGETSFSKLTYAEKLKYFSKPEGDPLDKIPNLQGFEYYKSGIFELTDDSSISSNVSPSTTLKTGNPNFPSYWDWRKKHGVNWMTSVKDQASCGSCWAFSAVAATETTTNLYYNQLLNLDLSEQDTLSCSGGGSCSGGWPYMALDYFKKTGVVAESCFPYMTQNYTCSKCATWQNQLVKIGGPGPVYNTEDSIKENIILKGVLSGSIPSWHHAMALLGWQTDTDGKPIWIYKNSWGIYWGEQGYVKVKMDPLQMGGMFSVLTPITINGQNKTVKCTDNDGDKYCNWGISVTKPSSCSTTCKPEKDCDDSNPNLGPYTKNYNCLKITHAECKLAKCVSVAGTGIDQCQLGNPCAIKITHSECQNNSCVKVEGVGTNECSTSTDCSTTSHSECINGQCIRVTGTGTNQCILGRSCTYTPIK